MTCENYNYKKEHVHSYIIRMKEDNSLLILKLKSFRFSSVRKLRYDTIVGSTGGLLGKDKAKHHSYLWYFKSMKSFNLKY